MSPSAHSKLRLAAWGAFGLVATAICVCALISGYRGAHARMGQAPNPAPRGAVTPEVIGACDRDLEALWKELNARLDATLSSSPARRSGAEWSDWSPGWRTNLLTVGARCRLDAADVPGARPVARVYRGLLALHRHYTTLVYQFSNEIGPHSDRLRREIEAARASMR